MAIFMGFHSPASGAMRELYDIELVKQDLLNHFMTHKGERVMDAEYGFIGWDLIFELKSPGIKSIIEQDARRIIQTEPRVVERQIDVIEEEHGFRVNIYLYFKILDSTSVLSMFFDADNASDQK